jgi:hypothetical protein
MAWTMDQAVIGKPVLQARDERTDNVGKDMGPWNNATGEPAIQKKWPRGNLGPDRA